MLGYDVPEVRDAVERQIASGVVNTLASFMPESFAIFSRADLARISVQLEVCTTPLAICRSTASRTSGTSVASMLVRMRRRSRVAATLGVGDPASPFR